MYVRIFWGKIKPGRWDEYEAHLQRKHSGPWAKRCPGFSGRQLLRSTENPDEGTFHHLLGHQGGGGRLRQEFPEAGQRKGRRPPVRRGILGEALRGAVFGHRHLPLEPLTPPWHSARSAA